MQKVMEHAALLGCRVYFLPLREGMYGYLATGQDVVINSRLPEGFQREVLAHELGHVHYGHDLRTRHDSPRDEARADMYAARLLISPTEYAHAETMYDGCHKSIAQELRVSMKTLMLWVAKVA
jgi:Zn-dependent peptidase ImmA (M78 family)